MYFITDSIFVDETKSITVLGNAERVGGRAWLLRNNLPGGTNEPIYYVRTVSDSLLVSHDNLAEAAKLLGIKKELLAEIVPENHRYHPDKADEE